MTYQIKLQATIKDIIDVDNLTFRQRKDNLRDLADNIAKAFKPLRFEYTSTNHDFYMNLYFESAQQSTAILEVMGILTVFNAESKVMADDIT